MSQAAAPEPAALRSSRRGEIRQRSIVPGGWTCWCCTEDSCYQEGCIQGCCCPQDSCTQDTKDSPDSKDSKKAIFKVKANTRFAKGEIWNEKA